MYVHDTVRVRINRSEGTNDAIVYDIVYDTVRVRTEVEEATTRPRAGVDARGDSRISQLEAGEQQTNISTLFDLLRYPETNLFSPSKKL